MTSLLDFVLETHGGLENCGLGPLSHEHLRFNLTALRGKANIQQP